MIKVIIAEDEPLARRGLRSLLEQSGQVEVLAECSDGAKALEAIRAHRPDLVFLDIQMPDLDGFGVLRELRGRYSPLVVFVTAYDNYAVEAFEVNAVDYLLKPFEWSRVAESLERARFFLSRRVLGRGQSDTSDSDGAGATLAVSGPEGAKRLLLADVIWVEARGNYLRLHTGSGHYLLREPLAHLCHRLADQGLMRVSRSAAINIDHVIRLASERGRLAFELSRGHRVAVSRRYRRSVEQALAGAVD